jgi:hypothetical protein
MPTGGQLKELRIVMNRLHRMLAGGQLRELHAMMHILLWKIMRVLTPERFCIPIGSRTCVMQIVRLTKANESNCRKSVAKKFEMLTV